MDHPNDMKPQDWLNAAQDQESSVLAAEERRLAAELLSLAHRTQPDADFVARLESRLEEAAFATAASSKDAENRRGDSHWKSSLQTIWSWGLSVAALAALVGVLLFSIGLIPGIENPAGGPFKRLVNVPPAATFPAPVPVADGLVTSEDLVQLPQDGIVIRVDTSPSHLLPESYYREGWHWSEIDDLPDFTLYADGTLMYFGNEQIVRKAQLSQEEILGLVNQVIKLGFEELTNERQDREDKRGPVQVDPLLDVTLESGSQADRDAASEAGAANAAGEITITSLSALVPGGERRTVSNWAETLNNPETFQRILDFLNGYEPPQSEVYRPEYASLVLYPISNTGGEPLYDWPLPADLPAEFEQGPQPQVKTLYGEALTQFLAALPANYGPFYFQVQGRILYAYLIPWLPYDYHRYYPNNAYPGPERPLHPIPEEPYPYPAPDIGFTSPDELYPAPNTLYPAPPAKQRETPPEVMGDAELRRLILEPHWDTLWISFRTSQIPPDFQETYFTYFEEAWLDRDRNGRVLSSAGLDSLISEPPPGLRPATAWISNPELIYYDLEQNQPSGWSIPWVEHPLESTGPGMNIFFPSYLALRSEEAHFIETEEVAGRDALVVDWGPYRLWVDRQTGVLLGQQENGPDGSIISDVRVLAIRYDASIPAGVLGPAGLNGVQFSETPPP